MNFEIINREDMVKLISDDSEKLSWGYFCPAKAKAAIGARLIYERKTLCTVNGRVTFKDGCVEGNKKLVEYNSDNSIIPALEKYLNDEGIQGNSEVILHGIDGNIHVLATPNASHGYIYFSIFEV